MKLLEIYNINIRGVACDLHILLAPRSLLVGSGWEQMGRLVGLLVLFCLILAGAVYVTKFIGNRAIGYKNNNIKIIETYRVSNTSAIQIVRIADKHLAIAITKDRIEVLAQLDKDSIIESLPSSEYASMQFGDILGKAKEKIISKKSIIDDCDTYDKDDE
jgi:flagellar protein FliO/FliZ